MPNYLFIKGDYGYSPGKPTATAKDNGNGTATVTVPGVPGAGKVILSWGVTSTADTAVVDITQTGEFVSPAYNSNTTVYFKAKAFSAGGAESEWSTIGNVAIVIEKAATPVADPVAGEYAEPQTVALTCATAGAEIHYTTNGDAPTSSSTEYTEPISVETTTTIKAIAVKTGRTDSEVLTAEYTITT